MKLIYPCLFIAYSWIALLWKHKQLPVLLIRCMVLETSYQTVLGQSKSNGGAGIAMSSNFMAEITLIQLHTIQSTSLFFLLEAGIDGRQSTFSNGIQKQSNHNINFSYFALAFRITPWWSNSLGLAPFSSVGNNINTTKAIEGSSWNFNVNLQGTGA